MLMHPWYRLSYQFGAILTKECRNCCQQPILNQNHVEPVQFSAVNVPFTSCNSFDRSSLGYNVSLQDIRLLLQSVTTVCLDHSSTVSIFTSNIDWQLFGDISLIARNIPPRNILPRNIQFQYWLVTIWKTSLSHSSLFSGKRTAHTAGLTLTWFQMFYFLLWASMMKAVPNLDESESCVKISEMCI